MTISRLLVLATMLSGFLVGSVSAQVRKLPLESADGVTLIRAKAEPATLQGRKGLRVTVSEEALRQYTPADGELNPLIVIDGLEFSSGVIEAEIAGAPAPGAGEAARGYVGIAFRVQNDGTTYDAFYLRPTNGRADDQERRNHALQYISHPDWPFSRLRKEAPSKYESYADLISGVWTKVKIEVRGDRARLYVYDQEQPTLIVNDLKTGTQGKGAVALWSYHETVAHFRDLRVETSSKGSSK